VALISTAFWLGIRSSFSVFYVVLLNDFHWSRGDSAGVQSIALITYTILAPLAGGLIDRFGPRRIIVPGILILSLGLILSSLIKDLFQFYLIYGVLMGSGITSIGIVTYSAIIAHWFDKKRGLASGIALSGMGLGTFTLVPFSQYAISTWGWRLTFVLLGCLVIIILLPLNGLFLRHKPQDLGLLPDGVNGPGFVEENDQAPCPQPADMDWTLKTAMKTKAFWALLAFPSLSIIGIYFILVHNVRFMVDHGINKMTAAFIFALIGVISSVFRIFWGGLSDRIGREKTYTMGMACGILGLLSLFLMDLLGEKGFAYPFFIFFGMGWGVSAPMFMAVAADLFKGKGFGLIYGIVEAGIGVAGAFGAWMGGFIFDRTQSYQGAIILSIIVMILSCVGIWIAAPRRVRQKDKRRMSK
jgi:MFS family permease